MVDPKVIVALDYDEEKKALDLEALYQIQLKINLTQNNMMIMHFYLV